MTDYLVRLNIDTGTTELEWETGTASVADPVQMLDGATISWAMPEGLRYPTQPDPMECQFTLRTLDAANVAGLVEGADIALEFWTPDLAGQKVASFYGRATDVNQEPVPEPDGSTWLYYTVVAVDYTADLAEHPVEPDTPDAAWPLEDVDDRLTRIAAYFPAGAPFDLASLASLTPMNLNARSVTSSNVLDVMLATMAEVLQFFAVGTEVQSAYFLVPQASYANGCTGYTAQWWPNGIVGDADQLPGVLQLVDDGIGGYVLVLSFSEGTDVDAGIGAMRAPVLFGANTPTDPITWRSGKGQRPNAVAITGEAAGVETTWNLTTQDVYGVPLVPPRLQLAYKSEVTDALTRALQARMLIPDPAQTPDSWALDEFTYLIPDTQLDLAWMPDHAQAVVDTLWGTWCMAQPAVLTDVEEGKAPNGVSFMAGRLTSVAWTVRKGEAQAKLRLRRGLPAHDAGGLAGDVTMDDLNTAIPDLTDHARHTANLVSPSGFEVDMSGWQTVGSNCTVARVTTEHMHGVGAACVTLTGVAGGLAYFSQLAANQCPVVALQTYRASLYWKTAAIRAAGFYVQWYTAASVFISQTVYAGAGTAAGVWQRADSGAITAPATAAFARIVPVVTANAGDTGMVHYVDSVQLEQTTELLPYEGPEYPTRYLDPELTWTDLNLVRSV